MKFTLELMRMFEYNFNMLKTLRIQFVVLTQRRRLYF